MFARKGTRDSLGEITAAVEALYNTASKATSEFGRKQ